MKGATTANLAIATVATISRPRIGMRLVTKCTTQTPTGHRFSVSHDDLPSLIKSSTQGQRIKTTPLSYGCLPMTTGRGSASPGDLVLAGGFRPSRPRTSALRDPTAALPSAKDVVDWRPDGQELTLCGLWTAPDEPHSASWIQTSIPETGSSSGYSTKPSFNLIQSKRRLTYA
jgi:hypothetical protein